MTVRSMTGFARARRPLGQGELAVSVKAVNHRGLDVHVRGPESADGFEIAVRALVKSHVTRGHIEVRIAMGGMAGNGAGPSLNRTMLDEYVRAFREAAAAHAPQAEPDLNAAFRIPGMFASAEEQSLPEGTEAILLDALAEALHQLNSFREREGEEIAAEMRKHNSTVASAAEQMEQIRAGALGQFQNRLAERLKELLRGAQVDPQRLAQEAALLAERSDREEEAARLRAHIDHFRTMLEGGGEIGKKLDFLLQEMGRETNTIGAKCQDANLSHLVVALKAEVERLREQVQNIE